MSKRPRQKTYKELFRVGEVVDVAQAPSDGTTRARWQRGVVVRITTRLHVAHVGMSGHLAHDRAMFNRGELRKAAPFKLHETNGSKDGRREVEIFAPDGYSFDGDLHSLIAHGATLEEAKGIAFADAMSMDLIECPADCDCRCKEVQQ